MSKGPQDPEVQALFLRAKERWRSESINPSLTQDLLHRFHRFLFELSRSELVEERDLSFWLLRWSGADAVELSARVREGLQDPNAMVRRAACYAAETSLARTAPTEALSECMRLFTTEPDQHVRSGLLGVLRACRAHWNEETLRFFFTATKDPEAWIAGSAAYAVFSESPDNYSPFMRGLVLIGMRTVLESPVRHVRRYAAWYYPNYAPRDLTALDALLSELADREGHDATSSERALQTYNLRGFEEQLIDACKRHGWRATLRTILALQKNKAYRELVTTLAVALIEEGQANDNSTTERWCENTFGEKDWSLWCDFFTAALELEIPIETVGPFTLRLVEFLPRENRTMVLSRLAQESSPAAQALLAHLQSARKGKATRATKSIDELAATAIGLLDRVSSAKKSSDRLLALAALERFLEHTDTVLEQLEADPDAEVSKRAAALRRPS